MLLSQFSLKNEPANIVARQIQAQLRTAVDLSSTPQNLLQSCEFGMDSAMWDMMYSGIDSNSDLFPMCRIYYGNLSRDVDDEAHDIVRTQVPLWLYFLYYNGVPSTDPVRNSFVELRESHIRMCEDWILSANLIAATDATGGDIWRWIPQSIIHDNDTPFKFIDSTFQFHPSSGYFCTRVDLVYEAKGVIAT